MGYRNNLQHKFTKMYISTMILISKPILEEDTEEEECYRK